MDNTLHLSGANRSDPTSEKSKLKSMSRNDYTKMIDKQC